VKRKELISLTKTKELYRYFWDQELEHEYLKYDLFLCYECWRHHSGHPIPHIEFVAGERDRADMRRGEAHRFGDCEFDFNASSMLD